MQNRNKSKIGLRWGTATTAAQCAARIWPRPLNRQQCQHYCVSGRLALTYSRTARRLPNLFIAKPCGSKGQVCKTISYPCKLTVTRLNKGVFIVIVTCHDLNFTSSESCCTPELGDAWCPQGQDGNLRMQHQSCGPKHVGIEDWRTAAELSPYQPNIHMYFGPNDCKWKKRLLCGLIRMKMRIQSIIILINFKIIIGLLTHNTPCHILLYVVGNVLIATDGVSNFPIKEFVYWTPLSWLYVNYWAGPRAPSIKQGSQE